MHIFRKMLVRVRRFLQLVTLFCSLMLLTGMVVGCRPDSSDLITPGATYVTATILPGGSGTVSGDGSDLVLTASPKIPNLHTKAVPSGLPSLPGSTTTPTDVPISPTPTACPPEFCSYALHFWLEPPIAPPGNQAVDVTYRFGSTQGKLRDPHHGVEFLNSTGTPVLAAAAGTVVVAGEDLQTRYSPYANFYGKLVIIEHAPIKLPGSPNGLSRVPIFTLYAHLSEVLVQEKQVAQAGQEIGKVGMSGAATGSHLHFEVRLGENSYGAARNPELWLQYRPDPNGQPTGGIAGRILDDGTLPKVSGIVIQHLVDGEQSVSDWEIYIGTYEEKRLRGQVPWGEDFAAGNLPPGWYRLSFAYFGLQSQVVQVFPGQVSVVTFEIGD